MSFLLWILLDISKSPAFISPPFLSLFSASRSARTHGNMSAHTQEWNRIQLAERNDRQWMLSNGCWLTNMLNVFFSFLLLVFSQKICFFLILFGWLDDGILFFVFQKYKILNPDAHTRREQRVLCEGGKEKYKYIRNGGWLGNIFMTLYGLGVVFWLFSWLLLDHLEKLSSPSPFYNVTLLWVDKLFLSTSLKKERNQKYVDRNSARKKRRFQVAPPSAPNIITIFFDIVRHVTCSFCSFKKVICFATEIYIQRDTTRWSMVYPVRPIWDPSDKRGYTFIWPVIKKRGKETSKKKKKKKKRTSITSSATQWVAFTIDQSRKIKTERVKNL